MSRVVSMMVLMVATAVLGLVFSLAATRGAGGALSTLGVDQPPALHLPSGSR